MNHVTWNPGFGSAVDGEIFLRASKFWIVTWLFFIFGIFDVWERANNNDVCKKKSSNK